MSESKGGGWAVAYRVESTQAGSFHDDAYDVDEKTARRVFGRCIRAGELGLPVEGSIIDGVRLLQWGDADTEVGKEWRTIRQHNVGMLERWKAMGDGLPYRETQEFHPGVPCHPGAWGSAEKCAMHWGLPLDENGLCIEGRRGAKLLGLMVIPKAMRDRFGFPATMTREELRESKALAIAELAKRGNDAQFTDEQICKAFATLDNRIVVIPPIMQDRWKLRRPAPCAGLVRGGGKAPRR